MKNLNKNWFALNRKFTDSELWLSEKFTRGQAWVDLIGLANHTEGHFRVHGVRVKVERGQVGRSVKTLAQRWRWSPGKVRRFINDLVNDNSIDQQKGGAINLISIVNYDLYQYNRTTNRSTNETTNETTNKPTNGPHTIRNKQDINNINNNEQESAILEKLISIFQNREWREVEIKIIKTLDFDEAWQVDLVELYKSTSQKLKWEIKDRRDLKYALTRFLAERIVDGGITNKKTWAKNITDLKNHFRGWLPEKSY